MKNKLFIKCIYLCILGGFLVNLRSITMFLNVETAEMILKKGFGTSLMNITTAAGIGEFSLRMRSITESFYRLLTGGK